MSQFQITQAEKSESKIQAEIIELLQSTPRVYVVKVHSATKSGVPDILTSVLGKFVAFEVKSLKGKASELQLQNIKRIRESGGYAYIVRSKEEVKNIITQILTGEL